MTVTFDTHKQHKSLVEAGLSDVQAEAISGIATAILSVVATKDDLKALEGKLDVKFDTIDKTLNRMNALIVGQFSATIGGVGIIVGAMFAVIAPHIR